MILTDDCKNDRDKLKKILLFVNDFKKSNLRSPSYREIGKELEMSLGAVVNAIQKLHNDKYVKKIPGCVGIKLTKKGKEVLVPCDYNHFVKENAQLRQLLGECENYLETMIELGADDKSTTDLLTHIKAVLK